MGSGLCGRYNLVLLLSGSLVVILLLLYGCALLEAKGYVKLKEAPCAKIFKASLRLGRLQEGILSGEDGTGLDVPTPNLSTAPATSRQSTYSDEFEKEKENDEVSKPSYANKVWLLFKHMEASSERRDDNDSRSRCPIVQDEWLWLKQETALHRASRPPKHDILGRFSCDQDYLLVYSLPWTGSTALQTGIGDYCRTAVSYETKPRDAYSRFITPQAMHSVAADFLQKVPRGQTVWILSVVKNPFERLIFAFFQQWKKHKNRANHRKGRLPVERRSELKAALVAFSVWLANSFSRNRRVMKFWSSFANVTEFNPLLQSFDHDSRVLIHSSVKEDKNMNFIFLRHEEHTQWHAILQSYFPGVLIRDVGPEFDISDPNTALLYEKFRTSFRFSSEEFACIRKLPDLRFYKLQEIPQLQTNLDIQATAGSVQPICLHGHAVPELYVLGHQKAGTTTFAADATHAGLCSAFANIKELHTFELFCDYVQTDQRCEFADFSWLNLSKKPEWLKYSGKCQLMTAQEKVSWAMQFRQCRSAYPTLTDMTPVNVRLPGLPRMMADLYDQSSSKLHFVIALIEPLGRMHSGFYQQECAVWGKFSKWVTNVVQIVDSTNESDWADNLSRSYFLDEFYRSLYSLVMKPWFDAFLPSQFLVIPMLPYLKGLNFRRQVFKTLRRLWNVTANANLIKDTSHRHARSHPSLDQDLSTSQVEELVRKYFDPDTRKLAELLARQMRRGLILAGYGGQPTTVSHVENYLKSNWGYPH